MMFQPMQGARRMTEDDFRKKYLCDWPTDQIARDRDRVLAARAAGLSLSEICRATGLHRRDVQGILITHQEGRNDA